MNLAQNKHNSRNIILSLGAMIVLIGIIFWFSKSEFFLFKQREFNEILMATIRELRQDVDISTLIYLSILSLFYGILHAIGPGHGKLFISGFLLNNS